MRASLVTIGVVFALATGVVSGQTKASWETATDLYLLDFVRSGVGDSVSLVPSTACSAAWQRTAAP